LCIVAHNLQRIQQYLDQLLSKLRHELKTSELLNQEEFINADIEKVLHNLIKSAQEDVNLHMQSLLLQAVGMATDELRQLVGFVTAPISNSKADCSAQVRIPVNQSS
jgi:hypothetical protein